VVPVVLVPVVVIAVIVVIPVVVPVLVLGRQRLALDIGPRVRGGRCRRGSRAGHGCRPGGRRYRRNGSGSLRLATRRRFGFGGGEHRHRDGRAAHLGGPRRTHQRLASPRERGRNQQ